jgi:N-acyl-D-aspartate/D-glutamate deacylase
MALDLKISGGLIVDGSGLPGYAGDVGIKDGHIAAIGDLKSESAARTFDAEGQVVAPGFIDGHTHMDAQVFWDPNGTCSCWHGVTSVVMGNCGFSLAPCAAEEKALAVRNLERAEDISPAAMEAGIPWSWTSFPEYLDALERTPKGINYAAYIGHSALRTHVMGERAFDEEAGADDLAAMVDIVGDAVRAGAIGFSTSRSRAHLTPDGRPVASRVAHWDEVRAIVDEMGRLGAGVVELAKENNRDDAEKAKDFYRRLKSMAVETGIPITFGALAHRKANTNDWRPLFDLADDTVASGGHMAVQATGRWGAIMLSFESVTPFDGAPVWRDIRKLPLAEQGAALRNPETKAKMIEAANAFQRRPGDAVGGEARPAEFDWIFPMMSALPPYRSLAEIAAEQGKDPVEVMIDMALEADLKQFFLQVIFNEDPDEVIAMLRHPRALATFSDSGAHVSQICDSSLQTYVLAHWVREREAMTLEYAVRKMTFEIACFFGLKGRGLLREGYAADVVVFDPATVVPDMPVLVSDLPTGARRLLQTASGVQATIVNGEVLLDHGEATGAVPGRVLRGPLAVN